jgi:hypothetical protein
MFRKGRRKGMAIAAAGSGNAKSSMDLLTYAGSDNSRRAYSRCSDRRRNGGGDGEKSQQLTKSAG